MRVQISLEDADYAALKKLAEDEDRTVAGQARHMLRNALAIAQAERNMPLNARLPDLQSENEQGQDYPAPGGPRGVPVTSPTEGREPITPHHSKEN